MVDTIGDDPVLVGDIGGTKTALAIVDGAGKKLHAARYLSRQNQGLEQIVEIFLKDARAHGVAAPRLAAFGVAGPARDDVCVTTNLPWKVDGRAIAAHAGLTRARVVNDFETAAYGVLTVASDAIATLQDGTPRDGGTIAVIGAGTGLGEAFLVCTGDRSGPTKGYRAIATEGGHGDYAASTDDEIELFRHLRARHGHVSWERVVSGIGIPEIYRFLRDERGLAESVDVAREIAADDAGTVIGRHALANDDALCSATIAIFVRGYGAEAGNHTLRTLATGGVYLTGGIAPKLLPLLRSGSFLSAFRDKGRLSHVVEAASVHVVLDEELPLKGAALVARMDVIAT